MDTLHRLLVFLALTTAVVTGATASVIDEIAYLRQNADSLHSIGRTDSALMLAERAAALAVKSGDSLQIVGTHSSMGVFRRSLGDVEGALECYGKALEIVATEGFRRQPDNEAVEEAASLYVNFAILQLDMGNKDDAGANARLAAQWAAMDSDIAFAGQIYSAASAVLMPVGDYDAALDFQAKAYDVAVETGDKDTALRTAAYAMLTNDRLGRDDEAEMWRGRCKALVPEVQAMMPLLAYYQCECSISLKNGRNADAVDYFGRILALDGIDALPFVQYDCYNNMHLAYAAMNDYGNAYSTLLKSTALRDSLHKQESDESLRELTVKYQTKETELALAQSENRRAQTALWLLGAVLLLLIVAAVFVFYASRQRRRRLEREMEYAALRADIDRRLTRQYVEGLESERARMARELHDGVCNDLMAIGMRIADGAPADETGRLLDVCRESVRRVSHELMPPEFSYATIDEVLRYYTGKVRDGGAPVEYASATTDGGWDSVPDNVALEVYRIAQEAVGNAVKHSGASRIAVTLTFADGVLTLEVADNGSSTQQGSGGIGLKSMSRRAKAVGGAVETSVLADRGFKVIFKVSF